MSLTKEQILQADDLPREPVDVPEWGGEVIVRTMTGKERDAFETTMLEAKDADTRVENIRARLAALTLVDAEGKRLFSDADIEALGAKSAAALDRVWEVAARLNKFSNADVEELAKNSSAGQGDDLPSD